MPYPTPHGSPRHTLTLSAADIANIERATLDAVAPSAIEAMEGWLIPFDSSTIGRAKSVVPLRHEDASIADLAGIAQRYQQRQLTPTFRIADVPGLTPVHTELRQQGYIAQQPTLVQVGSILGLSQLSTQPPALISNTAHAAWAQVYSSDGFDAADGQSRSRSLTRSTHAVYATLMEGGVPVAAGVASLSHGWASLHGIRTAAHARGRGYASRVLVALAQAAELRGLQRVFLQVEEENTQAIALYQRAGFATAWRYHYWRPVGPAKLPQHC